MVILDFEKQAICGVTHYILNNSTSSIFSFVPLTVNHTHILDSVSLSGKYSSDMLKLKKK
jgi:hypothetical protein